MKMALPATQRSSGSSLQVTRKGPVRDREAEEQSKHQGKVGLAGGMSRGQARLSSSDPTSRQRELGDRQQMPLRTSPCGARADADPGASLPKAPDSRTPARQVRWRKLVTATCYWYLETGNLVGLSWGCYLHQPGAVK